MTDVDGHLGKPIDDICGNGFVDHDLNHCAHFVSHAMGLKFGMTCKKLAGGSKPAANVRVHEVFAQCPAVGNWPAPPSTQAVLIFCTADKNVDLATKTMKNVPKKHIGIFEGGFVYHYSNTKEKVVRQTVAEFQKTFNKTYGGPQGYFWGIVPGTKAVKSAVLATSTKKAAAAAKLVGVPIEIEQSGNHFFGKIGAEKFYVATKTASFNGGLFQPGSKKNGPTFMASDWADDVGHWANLLELTGHCESENFFNILNTYDRARFTFGFYQLAAHTPDDNLVLFLRDCTKLTAAASYVPELTLVGGKLHLVTGSATKSLEGTKTIAGEKQLRDLMTLLNPTQPAIEPQELSYAARFVHWSNSDPELRALQVTVAARILENKVVNRYDAKVGLDGRPDTQVAVVADILHQGRAKFVKIKSALASTNPLDALIDINDKPAYEERQKQVREKLEKMVKAKRLGKMRYSRAEADFVPLS
jgi:hypothetical protein